MTARSAASTASAAACPVAVGVSDRELVLRAIAAREQSYSPYSGFAVGAALLCADGTVYTGCNIENAAFGPTNCAERTAFFKAISEGKREFSAIAIVGGPGRAESGTGGEPSRPGRAESGTEEKTAGLESGNAGETQEAEDRIFGQGVRRKLAPPRDICPPCGVCRQVMAEFCEPASFRLLLGRADLSYQIYTLEQLLPLGFSGKGVERNG